MKKFLTIALFILSYQYTFAQPQNPDQNKMESPKDSNVINHNIDSLFHQIYLLNIKIEKLNDAQVAISQRLIETREDYKNVLDDSHSTRNITLILVSIIVTVIGVIFPFSFNRDARHKQNEFETKQGEMMSQMNNILTQINEVKIQIDAMQGKIEISERQAADSRKQSYINKLFTQAAKEQNPNNAIELYSKILALDINNFDAYLMRASAYMSVNNNKEALLDLNKAIEIDRKDYRPYMLRSLVNVRTKQYAFALRDAETAKSYAPNEKDVYVSIAQVHYESSKWKEVIEDYDAAEKISPLSAIELNNRAYAYYKTGKKDIALADVEDALLLNDKLAAAYDTRGLIYSKKGVDYYDKALQDFNKAILLNNRAWEVYENRANLYKKLANLESDSEKIKEYRNLCAKDLLTFRKIKSESYSNRIL